MKVLSRLKKLKPGRIIGGALGLLLVVTLIVAPAPPALAVPQIAHKFHGSVTIDEEPAPEGVEVSATIAGVDEVFTATTDTAGKYHLLYVRGNDPDTSEKEGGDNGDEIEFYVDDVYATSYTFESGESTTLDLTVEGLEYGDAPDPTYPSLLASDGARHFQSPGAFLGLLSDGDNLDWELDANVPDQDLKDDGLVTTTITAGNPAETVTFEVTDLLAPSYDLRVNILIDLNADGDWNDAGEHVVVNQPITTTAAGTVGEVFVSDPFSTVGATPGLTWLRITLTRHEIQEPPWDGTMTGAGLWGWDRFECGETEDWAITIESAGGALSAAAGPNTPSAHGWYWDPEADPYNEMLQMSLTADPTEDIILNSVTVEASGTGNDATGIAFVDLVVDSNNNGLVDDPTELPPISTGTYAADNGSLTLTIPGGYTVTQGTTEYFIIDYQMTSLPSVGDTFIATVTAVSAVGASSGLSIPVSGLPIDSTTKTTVVVPQHTITVTQGADGTITPGTTVVDHGGSQAFTITPDANYHIADVLVDGDSVGAVGSYTFENVVADHTIEASFATLGTVTLSGGWNLLSTPIKLDADNDTLEQILGESLANIEASWRWDTQSQQWEVPTGYELSPLEAVYLKVSSGASATAEFIPSQEISELPSRELQPGLNLIGPAPALEAGVFPDTALDVALASIAQAEGGLTGYTMVVSPAHNQLGWSYGLGGEIKDLLPYKGYWVVMENADTLYGFSTTPISS